MLIIVIPILFQGNLYSINDLYLQKLSSEARKLASFVNGSIRDGSIESVIEMTNKYAHKVIMYGLATIDRASRRSLQHVVNVEKYGYSKALDMNIDDIITSCKDAINEVSLTRKALEISTYTEGVSLSLLYEKAIGVYEKALLVQDVADRLNEIQDALVVNAAEEASFKARLEAAARRAADNAFFQERMENAGIEIEEIKQRRKAASIKGMRILL